MRAGRLMLLIVVLLFCISKVNAQVPGYMGKKVVMGYGFYFNPALSNFVLDYADSPINTLHEFFLEGATKKRTMLGISVKLYKYTYNNIELVNPGSYYIFDGVQPEGNYLIKGKNVDLYGKFFRSRYLAPWGKYFKLGLSYISYETVYDPAVMKVKTSANGSSYTSNFGPVNQSFSYIDLLVGGGTSRIFANRIVLDCGYDINFISLMKMGTNWLLDDYMYDKPEEYIENTSAKRVAAINRLNLHIKLGYLF